MALKLNKMDANEIERKLEERKAYMKGVFHIKLEKYGYLVHILEKSKPQAVI